MIFCPFFHCGLEIKAKIIGLNTLEMYYTCIIIYIQASYYFLRLSHFRCVYLVEIGPLYEVVCRWKQWKHQKYANNYSEILKYLVWYNKISIRNNQIFFYMQMINLFNQLIVGGGGAWGGIVWKKNVFDTRIKACTHKK